MNNIQMIQEPVPTISTTNKPIELYIFIDPLCPEAFSMQATLRKLQLEYNHYFTWRFVLSTELTSLNCLSKRVKGCISGIELDINHPVLPSIAIKAAELQGKRAGTRYLSKLQEYVLLNYQDVNSYATLLKIAEDVQLDMNEFTVDFGSKEAARAFQCDLYIKREMEVDEVPSIVFFNECIEDEGLKVSGSYAYEVYEHILQEMLSEQLVRQPLPTIEDLFSKFHTLSTNEIAFIYSLTEQAAERELKKRMLQQKIERIQTTHATLWRLK
ncbi:DsbA family protein [Lysinibacillus macroides]|uniref:ClpXP adapter protein SpxH n=1 Tax=Lysinibacillus macroides TaxID=33935 RepID=A0A0N0CW16_9BACI|nr:DsbA family protein [Lysinibacillus macroides]KOY82424.1 dithiol-disulfide isomerase [Lysinibacillus macroides]QPR66538.1 DsbA family protein [Lysinibacillus macroides]